MTEAVLCLQCFKILCICMTNKRKFSVTLLASSLPVCSHVNTESTTSWGSFLTIPALLSHNSRASLRSSTSFMTRASVTLLRCFRVLSGVEVRELHPVPPLLESNFVPASKFLSLLLLLHFLHSGGLFKAEKENDEERQL